MNVHQLADQIVTYHSFSIFTDAQIVGDLVQESDKSEDFLTGRNNYTWWDAIGAVVKPFSVVEIGVRYGYSIKALLAERIGPACCVLAVDAESDPGQNSLGVFENYFRERGVWNLHIRKQDSQTLSTLNAAGYDIGSVDALHSADGCYHDCGLVWECLRPGGLMVVDDTQPGEVRDGCERFCRERGVEWAFLPSLRGIHLVLK